MAYTRSMGQQPWWFQLLAAGSDESDDEDYGPPVRQERLVGQLQRRQIYASPP
eukprot:COSAG02_NODE_23460_length_718_cov_0.867528_1_plen_52_part_10